MNLDHIRNEFPILGRRNYLNSCSLGALSHRAEGRLADFVAKWHDLGAAAWYEHWWGALGELRGRVEALFGAPSGTVALMPSTSACLAAVSSSLDWSKRNRIVTTELDFPTLLYQWKVRPDAEMVVLESHDGVHIDPQQYADVVDDRTLAIATSHVFFTTGAVQDLAAIAEIARRAGAYSLIDGYQGAGQVPIDLPATGVDFHTSGPLKWLCGGPGLAYLYVRDALIPNLEAHHYQLVRHRRPVPLQPRRLSLPRGRAALRAGDAGAGYGAHRARRAGDRRRGRDGADPRAERGAYRTAG